MLVGRRGQQQTPFCRTLVLHNLGHLPLSRLRRLQTMLIEQFAMRGVGGGKEAPHGWRGGNMS